MTQADQTIIEQLEALKKALAPLSWKDTVPDDLQSEVRMLFNEALAGGPNMNGDGGPGLTPNHAYDCILATERIATLQSSAVLPSEASRKALESAWTDFLDANPDDLTSPEEYPDHALVTCEQMIGIVEAAMRAATPTAPVQDDDAELVKRIDQRIAEHRAHLSELQAKYGRGVVPDERSAGLVVNFGDLLDLRSRLSPTPETGLVEGP